MWKIWESPFHQRGMFSTENTCVFITSIKLELWGLKQNRNIEPRIFAKLLKKCVYIQSHFPKYNRNKRAGGFWFLAKKQLHAQHMCIIYTVSAYIVFASEPPGTLVCPHPCKCAPRVSCWGSMSLGLDISCPLTTFAMWPALLALTPLSVFLRSPVGWDANSSLIVSLCNKENKAVKFGCLLVHSYYFWRICGFSTVVFKLTKKCRYAPRAVTVLITQVWLDSPDIHILTCIDGWSPGDWWH